MNPLQDTKVLLVTPPGAIVDNASLTTASIDTQGFRYLQVHVFLGATDIAMAALKLQASDTDSAYADVTGANFASGTTIDGVAATLPSATDDNKVFIFDVDLTKSGAKRYYDVVATGGDGTAGAYFTVVALLSKSESGLVTAASRGASQIIRV